MLCLTLFSILYHVILINWRTGNMEYWEHSDNKVIGWYQRHRAVLILVVLGAIMFFAANSRLFPTDPVESNYVQTAKEMLAAGDWLSPRIYNHYWYDKPILFYTELMAAFSIFGRTNFAARFFPALFSIIGVVETYWFAKRLYNERLAFYSAFIMMTTVEYFYLSKAIITDMTLFVTMNGALMLFYIAKREKRPSLYYVAYALAGVAILTKGPVGLVLPGLVILAYLAGNKDWRTLCHMKLVRGIILALAITAIWYVPMMQLHGDAFVEEFIGVHNVLRATVAEHPRNSHWWYYFVIFMVGCLPWSLSLPHLWKKYGRIFLWRLRHYCFWKSLDDRQRFLFMWVLVVWGFFQCMASKYPTYTFPYLPPLAIGLAGAAEHTGFGWVKRLAMATVIVFTALSYFVAVPLVREQCAYDISRLTVDQIPVGTPVYTYGGRYPVTLAYFSGLSAPRLVTRERVEELSFHGEISWNAKNMMPFQAIEDLPEKGAMAVIVDKSSQRDFQFEVPGTWQKLGEGGRWTLWRRE